MPARAEKPARPETKMPQEADAYSLPDFCTRHGISLQLLYKAIQQGTAPAIFRVGTRVLVSKEAATRWRAAREAATAAEAAE